MTRLILPVPPSDNASHRLVMRGAWPARIRTGTAKAYEEEVGWLARQWRGKTGWTVPPATQPVIERIWIYWPNRRTRDPANILKILHDSIKGILVLDDDQIWPQVWGVAVDRDQPRVELEFVRGEAASCRGGSD